ncbi:hypothetical protein L1F30_01085 [Simiduia sp. 21SJ11W-1]|uniref:hypothetical protein n=1 Tax=Simiduia sp. 21SJ11W-1 TaxID=2909669 RepID=UPI00209E1848|nr:hypothetical protein [Simiduia sp. 21SJ11W-1]UTA48150.1 hypothetical protein L1F30_01085 [Simiduia sp. 21SJ11W-1]
MFKTTIIPAAVGLMTMFLVWAILTIFKPIDTGIDKALDGLIMMIIVIASFSIPYQMLQKRAKKKLLNQDS